jgi:hypothetical protein
MPRFVILEHDHPEQHWDLMLEAEQVLRTWKLTAPPQAGTTIEAELSFDHRLMYLDYEGPISGNRGSVVRFDAGTFAWEEDSEEKVQVCLNGKLLQCKLQLLREADRRWQITIL